MSLSTRERWLIAAASPIVVVASYLTLVRGIFEAHRDSAQARIASMEAAGAATDRAQLEGVVDGLLAKRDALAKRDHECIEGEQMLLKTWPSSKRQTSTVTAINEILEREGAHVEHSRRAAKDDIVLAVALRDLERAAVAWGAGSPTVWRFDLRAAFPTLVAALAELREPNLPAIPLALQVEPVENFDQLHCTLWVWI